MHIEFLVEEASTEIALKQIVPKIIGNKLFLVDFGAVKVVKPQQRTATGTIIGSAEYCAPEQSLGKPLFISDLYSLGVTCLHLLTGISPFDLYSPLEGEWVWRDYLNGNVVSDKLGKILDKLAHPIPKHRYQSIPEVINAIESYDTTTVRASIGNYLIGKYIAANSDAKVIFNGDGSDEICGGYLYMNLCPDAIEYDMETRRLLKDIYFFDEFFQ